MLDSVYEHTKDEIATPSNAHDALDSDSFPHRPDYFATPIPTAFQATTWRKCGLESQRPSIDSTRDVAQIDVGLLLLISVSIEPFPDHFRHFVLRVFEDLSLTLAS